MSKILTIENGVITIGTDDGGIKEARACDLNFVPHVNDEVEYFETENKLIVSKVEPKQPAMPFGSSGININVQNTQELNQTGNVVGNGKKAVNKVVYCLLAFFLGSIGGHKFYAGRTGSGICYLLFCWTFIPAFIALIELIVALCQKSDGNGNILV